LDGDEVGPFWFKLVKAPIWRKFKFLESPPPSSHPPELQT
jgi:hypothetical protein